MRVKIIERPVSSQDESPKQRSLEDQFAGLRGLQERGRYRRTPFR